MLSTTIIHQNDDHNVPPQVFKSRRYGNSSQAVQANSEDGLVKQMPICG